MNIYCVIKRRHLFLIYHDYLLRVQLTESGKDLIKIESKSILEHWNFNPGHIGGLGEGVSFHISVKAHLFLKNTHIDTTL